MRIRTYVRGGSGGCGGTAGTDPAAALRVVRGPDRRIFDVLQMTSPVDQRTLHAYAHGARPEGT